MNLQFNCPQCGLAIQATTDSAGGTAQCPDCGQQFMVEASLPAMPVVKAQVVPAPVQHPSASQSEPVANLPQHPSRPPLTRPGPGGRPHLPARSRFEAPPVNQEAVKDKLRFLGLAVAGGLLLIAAIWVTVLASRPAHDPTQPTPQQLAANDQLQKEQQAEEDKIQAEKDRNAQVQKDIEKQVRDQNEKELKKTRDEEDKKRQDRQRMIAAVAKRHFNGDLEVAEAFVKAMNIIQGGLADLIESGNGPKNEGELDDYYFKHLLTHFELDPALRKWIKDQNRDPKAFIDGLHLGGERSAGREKQSNGFDFSKYVSSGSGFVVSADGWILTNEHVVADAKVVDIRLPDGRILQGKVIKTDAATDLAFVKADLTTASWLVVYKTGEGPGLGRTVFTVGYPDPQVQGVEPKFTSGSISSLTGAGDRKDRFQTSVPVRGGNSGGPLVDFESGLVVGVVNSKLGAADNVSYAIKFKEVGTFFDSVQEARMAAKSPPKPIEKGAVIKRVTDSSILILRRR